MPTRRVLVIEDNPDAAEALAMLLRAAGHEVAVALAGDAGLDAALAFRPAVVLCDLRLVGPLDGTAVARALRSDPATRGAVLLALSGLADPEERERARAAGFDRFLEKPADPGEILRLISAAGSRE